MSNEIVMLSGNRPLVPVTEAADPQDDIRIGKYIAIFFFVILLGLAAFLPLDAGVYAHGKVGVMGNRQSVQHRDGGVVTAIHVREGQNVKAGDVLIEMAAPELRAQEERVRAQAERVAKAKR